MDAQREARDKILSDIERSPSNDVKILDSEVFRAAYRELSPGHRVEALDAMKRKVRP